jgi:hypothetical protein
MCTTCPTGYTNTTNATSCTAWSTCAAGTEQTAAGTASTNTVCTSCPAGTYCAGGSTPKVTCSGGTWDHDSNSSTPCVASSFSTPPGDLISGTPLTVGYGFRKLRIAYAGSAIRVRRSSDNTEQDIGFNASGELDRMGLSSFVGPENLVLQSQTFNVSPWAVQGSQTLTADAVTAPDGSTTAETWTSSGTPAYLYQTVSLAAGTYTLSLYAKAGTTSTLRVDFVTSASAKGFRTTFDLSQGTVTQNEHFGGWSGASSITAVGSGWYRCALTLTVLATEAWLHEITHTTLGSVHLWGAQVSGGAELQSYVATTSAARAGGDGFLTTWFDQSGGLRHATQTTTTLQPRIMAGGKLEVARQKPAARFDGADDYMQFTSSWTNRLTLGAFVERSAQDTDHYILDNSNDAAAGGGVSLRFRNTNTTRFWNGNGALYSATTTGTTLSGAVRYVTGTSPTTANIVAVDTGTDSTQTASASRQDVARTEKNLTRIGHSELFGGFYNGRMSELLAFSDALSASDRASLEPTSLGYFMNNLCLAATASSAGYATSCTSSIISLYDAGTTFSYPGTGTSLFDISGNGRDATLVNGVGFSTQGGGSFVFDGSNDFVDAGDVVRGRTSLSIEVWFRTTDTRTGANGTYHNPAICGTQHGSGVSGDFILSVKAGKLGIYHELGGNGFLDTGVTVSDGTWKHVVVTKSTAGAMVIYLNGTQIYSGSGFTSAFRTSDLVRFNWEFGRTLWFPEDASMLRFNGSIAVHALYANVLTPSEVTSAFNARRARFGL